jgi:hypothetical protein
LEKPIPPPMMVAERPFKAEVVKDITSTTLLEWIRR